LQKSGARWARIRRGRLSGRDSALFETVPFNGLADLEDGIIRTPLDPDVKIVMVSAMGQQPMVIEAIQAGANDFIVKPFQPERVIEAISKVLA